VLIGAYWKRPRAYLDPIVRGSISTFSKIGNFDAELADLQRDIDSGAWAKRYSNLQDLTELDLGYRLVIVALRDHGVRVEYLVAPDEGHVLGVGQGFARPVNNQAIFAALEKFLAQYLGTRYQDGMEPAVAQRLKELTVDPKSVAVVTKRGRTP
jgi:hypothetical protein